MPLKDIFKVRGIGVAVNVITSTSARSARRRSFCLTPNRCSSSMITKPRSLKAKSEPEYLMGANHDVHFAVGAAFGNLGVLAVAAQPAHRLSMLIGHWAKRSRKVSKCCWANSVVGTKMTTCLLFCAATKAARMATSVLPKPTSPANQAVHGPLSRKILQRGVNGILLIVGDFKWKFCGEFFIVV